MNSAHHSAARRFRSAMACAAKLRRGMPAGYASTMARAYQHAETLPDAPLDYLATYQESPEHAPRSAVISAHALATRQQLIGIAKAALGLTGRPFRSPVETPEGITQEQKRERLTITPAAPLRPEDISDDEV